MLDSFLRRAISTAWLVAAAIAVLCGAAASAQQPGTPGKFDYWVESLSWSPGWCARHGGETASRLQCRGNTTYGLIVHGLWPQYEDGTWPATCRDSDRLPQQVVDKLLPDTPSDDLVRHEWSTHGTCTGLAPDEWVATVDKTFHKLRVPDELADPKTPPAPTAAELKAMLVKANPGLSPDGVALICGRDRQQIEEIRVCLNRDFGFRPCGAKVVDSCRGKLELQAAK